MLLVICALSLHFLLPIFLLLNVLQGDSSHYILSLNNSFMVWFLFFFPSWTCCRVTVPWGSGMTTHPLSKSPPWATRPRWARAGTSTDAPLVGPNHPRRWAELKGHRWAVKWVACTIRINFFLCTFYIQSVLMWIGFRKDVMGRDFFSETENRNFERHLIGRGWAVRNSERVCLLWQSKCSELESFTCR